MIHLRRLALAGLFIGAGLAPAAADSPDAVMAQFFGTWDDNAKVTPEAVQSLYAHEVLYYGRSLSNAGVYADKRAFVRRWPSRRYRVVPGTVSRTCDAAHTRCAAGVTLAWHARSDARAAEASGTTRVSLTLATEDGTLKIVREDGRPVH